MSRIPEESITDSPGGPDRRITTPGDQFAELPQRKGEVPSPRPLDRDLRRHLPSIIGCAFGFCATGSGVGSLVGTALNHRLFPPLPPGQKTPHEQFMAFYGGTFWGIGVGMGVGVAAGVVYAVLVRRSRRRRHQHHRLLPGGERGTTPSREGPPPAS
jgi:hypothetical protein